MKRQNNFFYTLCRCLIAVSDEEAKKGIAYHIRDHDEHLERISKRGKSLSFAEIVTLNVGVCSYVIMMMTERILEISQILATTIVWGVFFAFWCKVSHDEIDRLMFPQKCVMIDIGSIFCVLLGFWFSIRTGKTLLCFSDKETSKKIPPFLATSMNIILIFGLSLMFTFPVFMPFLETVYLFTTLIFGSLLAVTVFYLMDKFLVRY